MTNCCIIKKLLVASRFHIYRLWLCMTQDEDWGEKNNKPLSKKASPNSCHLIASLEINFPHPGSPGAALKPWVACRNITWEGTKAGPTSDAPFALLWWRRRCEAEQKRDSHLLALTPPPPIAAPDVRTSPAHPHQEICTCFSKPELRAIAANNTLQNILRWGR